MDGLLGFFDSFVIQLYRMTGNPLADFFLGTLLLAFSCVAAGEVSVLVLRRVNRSHMEKLDGEMSEKHTLSLEAKKSGDQNSYQQLNREANDAFGRVFFNLFTFSAASLWPAFFALAWMQSRFSEIEFPLPLKLPLLGETVSFVFIFLLYYVLFLVFFRGVKRLAA